MKTIWLTAAWTLLAGMACGSEPTVTVCLRPSNQIGWKLQGIAKGYATRLYRSIGVNLRWKNTCPADDNGASTDAAPNLNSIAMAWSAQAAPSATAYAYAQARPYQAGGTRIVFFLDRLEPALQEPPLAAAILGHVFAHEIGHILLGHNGHATEGLMKAAWTTRDQSGMNCHLLGFTADQALEIRQALEQRKTQKHDVAD